MNFYVERIDKLASELPRECVEAFKRGGIEGVYAWASQVSPRLYPVAKGKLTKAQQGKAAELYADCFLLREGK